MAEGAGTSADFERAVILVYEGMVRCKWWGKVIGGMVLDWQGCRVARSPQESLTGPCPLANLGQVPSAHGNAVFLAVPPLPSVPPHHLP
jgi:hypothetical protein